MNQRRSVAGFTLIEVMVVVVIASLMVAILVFGFDQTLQRRKSAASEELLQWLQSAADTAVFQSTVIGVAEQEEQLILLAFYQDDWYRLDGENALTPSEEIEILWSESLIRNNDFYNDQDDDRGYSQPYVVILPSGEILPEGEIQILNASQNTVSNGQLSPIQDELVASIHWQENKRFALHWQVSP